MSGKVQGSKIYRWDSSVYLLYNLLGLSIFSAGLYTVFTLPLPKELEDAGHVQFLTNLSLIFTVVAVFSNISTILAPGTLINTVNIYLNAIALILEILVALIYWSLKILFIHLIISQTIDPKNYIPLYLDFAIHLFPISFLSFDYLFIKYQRFNIPSFKVLLIISGLTASYWFLLESIIVPPASYPYPFLNVATEERIVIFAVVALFGYGFYHASNFAHNTVQKLVFKTEQKLKNN